MRPLHPQAAARSCRPAPGRRSGAVLVVALACMVVVMGVLGAMLQGALRCRRQMHLQRDLVQTELLVQAGIDRAAISALGNPNYRGETWILAPADIVAAGEGRVSIKITDQSDRGRRVTVVAEYPYGAEQSVRRTRSFVTQIPNKQISE